MEAKKCDWVIEVGNWYYTDEADTETYKLRNKTWNEVKELIRQTVQSWVDSDLSEYREQYIVRETKGLNHLWCGACTASKTDYAITATPYADLIDFV